MNYLEINWAKHARENVLKEIFTSWINGEIHYVCGRKGIAL